MTIKQILEDAFDLRSADWQEEFEQAEAAIKAWHRQEVVKVLVSLLVQDTAGNIRMRPGAVKAIAARLRELHAELKGKQ